MADGCQGLKFPRPDEFGRNKPHERGNQHPACPILEKERIPSQGNRFEGCVTSCCLVTRPQSEREIHLKKHRIGDTVIALKQYRFKLQAVLDYRAEQLNMIQQQVAEAEHQKILIQKRIQDFDEVIAQAFTDQQQQMASGALNPDQLQQFPHYVWSLKQNRFQETQRLQAQEQKLAQLRGLLQQALIKKKSLDTLREKDFAKYQKSIEKAEEEFLAEIALTRACRKNPVSSR